MLTDDGYELNWLDLVLYYGYQYVPSDKKAGFQDAAEQAEDRRNKRVHKVLRVIKPNQKTEDDMREFALLASAYFHQLPAHRQAFMNDHLWYALGRFNQIKPDDLVPHTNAFMARTGAVLEMKMSLAGSPELGLSQSWLNNLLIEPFMRFTTAEPQWLFQCNRCGLPYHPQRSDSTFCGATCRSGARRERQQ